MSTSPMTSSSRRRIRRILTVAALASAAIASSESTASAAAVASGCYVNGLPNGTSLPANAPGYILNDHSQGATATVSVALVTGDTRVALVGPVKDAHGLNVVLFSSSPAPSVGTHTIDMAIDCSVEHSPQPSPNPTTVVLTAAVPFPASVGTVTVRPSSPPTGNDEVTLEASPNLRAFFPITVMKVIVNDDATTTTTGTRENPTSGSVKFNAHTGSVCVENGALHREKRTVKVKVSADIAGLADSPAPAIIDVPVDCGAIRWTTEADFRSPKNSPADEATTTTPTTTSPNGASSTSNETTSGCAVATPRTPSGLAGNVALLVVGALALAGLRRRRRANA